MAPARSIRNLSCDEDFSAAAGKIIWVRFEEMMSFRHAARKGEAIETVHDMRVASRRLRAALELFRDVFPAKRFRPLLRDTKRVSDALGEVRDIDVMIERLERDMKGRPISQRTAMEEIVAELSEQREIVRRALKRLLDALERDDFERRFLTVVAQEAL